MGHGHQHPGVVGKLPADRARHDVCQGGAQASAGDVHDVPGWARGHVLVHPLPVHLRLHPAPHHHQHLLLPHPLPRLPLDSPRQAQTVTLGQEGHQDSCDGYRPLPDLLVPIPCHPGDQPE